jgi:hypothetical protein
MDARISPSFRLLLAAKAILLLVMAGLFDGIAWRVGVDGGRWWSTRVAAALLLGPLGLFLGWAALLALADAVAGGARRFANAVALRSRRAGYSLRLPDGRFAEFILHNPWSPLEPNATYSVTVGRYSRVIVARPEAANDAG